MTRRQSLLLLAAASLLLACACAWRGFLQLFSLFHNFDDTGFMLTLIQQFNGHGRLYQEVFSHYGPFYSEFYFLIGRVLLIPITQDGIRCVTLALWITASVFAGLVGYRVTRSTWVALLVQLVAFQQLGRLMDEPGHPISLVAVLLGALAFALTAAHGEKPGRTQAIFIGALIGALLMTKINLGLFALAAAGVAWTFCCPHDLRGRLLRWVVGSLFCLCAILLVSSLWSAPTRLTFLVWFMCTVAAVLVSARGNELGWPELTRSGLWAVGGMSFVILLAVSAILCTGTAWRELIEGVLLRPLTLGNLFAVEPPDMQPHLARIAVGSLVAACTWRFVAPRWELLCDHLSLILRLLFVAIFIAWLLEICNRWTLFPFLWVAVLPAGKTESPSLEFGRLALVLLAISQVLGIYPVAGAQITIPWFLGSLGLVPVLAGILEWRHLRLRWPAPQLRFGFALLLVASIALATVTAWNEVYQKAKRKYRSGTALQLPGSSLLRLDPASVAIYRSLAENLRVSRPSFLTVPGLNSLYGWAERPLPTSSNPTMNFAILDTEEQQRMVDVGRSCRPIALVHSDFLISAFWVRGRFEPSGPLIQFIRQECRVIARLPRGYDLLSLKTDSPPKPTYCAVVGAEPSESDRPPEITVLLPVRFTDVRRASVRDMLKPKRKPRRWALEERSPSGGMTGNDVTREFFFQNPKPQEVTAGSGERFLVQVWDSADRLLAELPFALLSGSP